MVDIDVSALTLTPWDIILRFVAAMLIGGVIGMEREYTHRPAGLRTHMMVSLGACAVMITSQAIFAQYRLYGATPDPARLSAQVITGVGFLGAGTIMREGSSIKGLTTAASVWAVACLGVAVGGGYLAIGFIGMLCMMVTLIVFESLQKKLMHTRNSLYTYKLTCQDVVKTLEVINALAGKHDSNVVGIHVDEPEEGSIQIVFRADFIGRHSDERMHQFLAALSNDPCTQTVTVEKTRT
ncbi:MAG: MgtC/SapB family protein [Clostridia bacterium]|nr:MgtC/SapB family protein [Clostridia bacterium]